MFGFEHRQLECNVNYLEHFHVIESLLVINKCSTTITHRSSRTFRFYSDNKFYRMEVLKKNRSSSLFNTTLQQQRNKACIVKVLFAATRNCIRLLNGILMGIVRKTIINIAFQTHIKRTWCLAYEHFCIFLIVRQLPILFFASFSFVDCRQYKYRVSSSLEQEESQYNGKENVGSSRNLWKLAEIAE